MTGLNEEFLKTPQPKIFSTLLLEFERNFGSRSLTAMSNSPSWAARWSEVLPLSAKSGFCRLLGLFLMMRLRRVRSWRQIARRMRIETSILGRFLLGLGLGL